MRIDNETEHRVWTWIPFGKVIVRVGDPRKTGLIRYPDLGTPAPLATRFLDANTSI